MSYEKQIINSSMVDIYLELFAELQIPYKLEQLEIFLDCSEGSLREHQIRRVEYGAFVILERLECCSDCDTDDVICSYKFPKDEEPEFWNCRRRIDEEGCALFEEHPVGEGLRRMIEYKQF